MKRKSSLIISLLLALILLSGCALPMDFAVSTVEEETERPEPVHFSDIEYVRPEIDEAYATVDALHGVLNNPFKYKKIKALIDEFYAQLSNYETMYSLMNIYRSCDAYDEFYEDEYSLLLDMEAEFDLLIDELQTACAESIHSTWLEPMYFWEGFTEEYRSSEGDVFVAYEDILDNAEREAELLAEYRALASERIIEIGGREVLLDEYLAGANDYEYDAALEAYYEKYNPLLAQVYIELMEVRKEYAELWDEESYAAMEYKNSYSRDYDPDKAELFMERIKYWVAPLKMELYEVGLDYDIWYNAIGEHELMLYLETAAEGFGGQIEEAFEYMEEYGMYDFDLSSNKMGTSFQSYLSDYEAPYLFLNPIGDSEDVITLAHEFGHYANSYISRNAYLSMDLAEIFSQSMQYLFLEKLENVMPEEELENLRHINLFDSLDTFLYQTVLAEFEQRAYELESPSPEELNQLFYDISWDYYMESDNETITSMQWVDVPHLFESPFYVISYAVSASAALEIYELEQEEEGLGRDIFVLMSESELDGLEESLENAGLSEDLLSESRVRHNAEFLRDQLFGYPDGE